MSNKTATSEETALPRVALLISDEDILLEIEKILRAHYSSIMLITAREKIAEFSSPLLVVTDTVEDVSKTLALPPVAGTQVLIIASEKDSESSSAAFEAGAVDYLAHPFVGPDVLAKIEKYLEAYRHSV